MSDQRKQGLVEETTKVKAATAAAEILSCKSRVAAHTLPIMRPRAGMQTLVRHSRARRTIRWRTFPVARSTRWTTWRAIRGTTLVGNGRVMSP